MSNDYGTVHFGNQTHVYVDDDRHEQVEYKGQVTRADGGGFTAEDANGRAVGTRFATEAEATDAIAGR